MSPLVIDDEGNWWEGGGRKFRERFFLRGVEGDVVSPLIREMGFIGVLLRPAGIIVRFNPKSVTDPAFARLSYWLGDDFWRRVVLDYAGPDHPVGYRFTDSGMAALRAMQGLMVRARGQQLPFASLSDTFEHLEHVAALAPVWDHWRNSGGIYVEADYRPLLSQRARDRFIIFTPRSRDGDLKIVQAGAGLHIPDKQSHAALPGSQLTDVADRSYGQWTSGIYRGVLQSQEPRFDHIYALINWPSVGHPVERRYRRLILPCRTKDGESLLLGVSCDPGAPDLDLEAA